jgi:hypothetical protein
MKFGRIVFWLAGAFGLLALVPLYQRPGDAMYYGMLATLAAWQVAFFMIGSDPKRFRLLMIPAILEKGLWMATLVVLYFKGQVTAVDLGANSATHGLLGALFIAAYFKAAR